MHTVTKQLKKPLRSKEDYKALLFRSERMKMHI